MLFLLLQIFIKSFLGHLAPQLKSSSLLISLTKALLCFWPPLSKGCETQVWNPISQSHHLMSLGSGARLFIPLLWQSLYTHISIQHKHVYKGRLPPQWFYNTDRNWKENTSHKAEGKILFSNSLVTAKSICRVETKLRYIIQALTETSTQATSWTQARA